jgi:hypothetical protein
MEMDAAREVLVSAAVRLFEEHNVAQGDMFTWIRDSLKLSAARSRPTRVLVNVAYGGMSFSHSFRAFLARRDPSFEYDYNSYDPETRVRASAFVVPFAEELLSSDMMRGVRDVLALYHKHGFRLLSAPFDDARHELFLAFPEPEALDDAPEGVDFLQRAGMYGIWDARTWKPVCTCDARMIDFLHVHKSMFDAATLTEEGLEHFGLLAASGARCCLCVEAVPAGMGWRVRDYDGSESLVLD